MEHAKSQANVLQEHCPECGHQTPHAVALEIRTEAGSTDDVGHSRTPYRVTECQQCGFSSSRRMNNV